MSHNDPHAPQFSDAAMAEFNDLCSRYPNKMAPLLMVLHLAEREFGWLSDEVQAYVAGLLELPASHVSGVVTFYTMYKQVAKGEKRIQFCSTLSCAILGSEKVWDHFCSRLGLGRKGGKSTCGKVSIEKVECLGACDWAPMMLVNEDTEKHLTPERVDELLREWNVEFADA